MTYKTIVIDPVQKAKKRKTSPKRRMLVKKNEAGHHRHWFQLHKTDTL